MEDLVLSVQVCSLKVYFADLVESVVIVIRKCLMKYLPVFIKEGSNRWLKYRLTLLNWQRWTEW